MNKHLLGTLAACIALIAVPALAASPTSPEKLSFGPGRPVPAGNAQFGQDTFHAVCFACHSHDLSGGKGPPLTGPKFYTIWQGRRVDALVDFIHNRMPQDEPGFLTEEMAQDLVAYIVTYANKPGSLKPSGK